jgi:hypothetical protein
MQYQAHEGKVVYTSKDGRTHRIFPALKWLAAMCSHIPNRGEQLVQYHRFGITIRHFSSTGNHHLNSKPKIIDKVGASFILPTQFPEEPEILNIFQISSNEDSQEAISGIFGD